MEFNKCWLLTERFERGNFITPKQTKQYPNAQEALFKTCWAAISSVFLYWWLFVCSLLFKRKKESYWECDKRKLQCARKRDISDIKPQVKQTHTRAQTHLRRQTGGMWACGAACLMGIKWSILDKDASTRLHLHTNTHAHQNIPGLNRP